jgi:hypothetical protein
MTAGTPRTGTLEKMLEEALFLRLRLLGLTLSGVLLVAASIIVAFGAFGTAALGAPALRLPGLAIPLPIVVFVLGLAMVIGAGVTLLRVSVANERAGAASRLLGERARVRSVRVRPHGALTHLHLVFEDGHRADLELTSAEADALLPLIEARRTSRS